MDELFHSSDEKSHCHLVADRALGQLQAASPRKMSKRPEQQAGQLWCGSDTCSQVSNKAGTSSRVREKFQNFIAKCQRRTRRKSKGRASPHSDSSPIFLGCHRVDSVYHYYASIYEFTVKKQETDLKEMKQLGVDAFAKGRAFKVITGLRCQEIIQEIKELRKELLACQSKCYGIGGQEFSELESELRNAYSHGPRHYGCENAQVERRKRVVSFAHTEPTILEDIERSLGIRDDYAPPSTTPSLRDLLSDTMDRPSFQSVENVPSTSVLDSAGGERNICTNYRELERDVRRTAKSMPDMSLLRQRILLDLEKETEPPQPSAPTAPFVLLNANPLFRSRLTSATQPNSETASQAISEIRTSYPGGTDSKPECAKTNHGNSPLETQANEGDPIGTNVEKGGGGKEAVEPTTSNETGASSMQSPAPEYSDSHTRLASPASDQDVKVEVESLRDEGEQKLVENCAETASGQEDCENNESCAALSVDTRFHPHAAVGETCLETESIVAERGKADATSVDNHASLENHQEALCGPDSMSSSCPSAVIQGDQCEAAICCEEPEITPEASGDPVQVMRMVMAYERRLGSPHESDTKDSTQETETPEEENPLTATVQVTDPEGECQGIPNIDNAEPGCVAVVAEGREDQRVLAADDCIPTNTNAAEHVGVTAESTSSETKTTECQGADAISVTHCDPSSRDLLITNPKDSEEARMGEGHDSAEISLGDDEKVETTGPETCLIEVEAGGQCTAEAEQEVSPSGRIGTPSNESQSEEGVAIEVGQLPVCGAPSDGKCISDPSFVTGVSSVSEFLSAKSFLSETESGGNDSRRESRETGCEDTSCCGDADNVKRMSDTAQSDENAAAGTLEQSGNPVPDQECSVRSEGVDLSNEAIGSPSCAPLNTPIPEEDSKDSLTEPLETAYGSWGPDPVQEETETDLPTCNKDGAENVCGSVSCASSCCSEQRVLDAIIDEIDTGCFTEEEAADCADTEYGRENAQTAEVSGTPDWAPSPTESSPQMECEVINSTVQGEENRGRDAEACSEGRETASEDVSDAGTILKSPQNLPLNFDKDPESDPSLLKCPEDLQDLSEGIELEQAQPDSTTDAVESAPN